MDRAHACYRKKTFSAHSFFLPGAVLLTMLVSDRRYFPASRHIKLATVPNVAVGLATGSAFTLYSAGSGPSDQAQY